MSGKALVYTEMLGLREVDDLYPSNIPVGAFVRGSIDDRVVPGWYRRVWSGSLKKRTLDWVRIPPDQLPKRLKMEALLLDIPL